MSGWFSRTVILGKNLDDRRMRTHKARVYRKIRHREAKLRYHAGHDQATVPSTRKPRAGLPIAGTLAVFDTRTIVR
jgi:hypothetical protein